MTTKLDLQSTMFAVDISASTDIEASAAQVWSVLTETSAYPEWNPFIRSFAGSIALGERLEVTLQPAGRSVTTMKPQVVEFTAGRTFAWLGRVGIPGVMDGRHRFEVQPIDAGHARFVQSERLSGALVPAFRSMLTDATPRSFVAMNDALAERVRRVG